MTLCTRDTNRERRPSSGIGARIARRTIGASLLIVVGGAICAPIASAALAADARPCVGDCDGGGVVTVDEIVTGLGIALGSVPLDRCPIFDCNGAGRVGIDCVVAAVDAALNGCAGTAATRTPTPTGMPTPIATQTGSSIGKEALAAAARISTEPIFRIFELQDSIGPPGGAGRSTLSGCQQFDCIGFFGRVTGTVEDCCSDGQFSRAFDDCRFEDTLGRVNKVNGLFSLRSDSLDVCSGAIPVGVDFSASLNGFTLDVSFPDGSFSHTFEDVSESFEATTGGCTARQREQMGFGVRGDGRRSIDGTLRRIETDGSGNVLVDRELDVHDLEINVSSTGQPDACTVTAALNGSLFSADAPAKTQFGTELGGLDVVQPPGGGALLLTLNGTVNTDCLGQTTLSTVEPLRVLPDDECFAGGSLNVRLGDARMLVSHAETGVDLDFAADGSVDQHFASCSDVPADQCAPTSVGLCGPCTATTQCAADLSCISCTGECKGDVDRCSLPDTFVTCGDGIF